MKDFAFWIGAGWHPLLLVALVCVAIVKTKTTSGCLMILIAWTLFIAYIHHLNLIES